jgi:hypothetical protein
MIKYIKMIIKGGYITGTNSARFHPIKNIKIKKSDDWTRISVKVHNQTISVCNIGTDVSISLQMLNDYNIGLIINNKEHYKNPQLYEFEVTIDSDNESIVQIINETIIDS